VLISANNMLKIGIVGVGHFGKNHLKCLKQSDKFELVGFYDIDTEVCEQVEDEYNVPSYKNFIDLISSIDVLDVVTPASTHYEYAHTAISLNKHVFVEKPLAISYTEALALSKMLTTHPVKLQVGHIERFNPAYSAAIPYLKLPLNIVVERNGTYNLRNKDVSVIEDLMLHDIDIILKTVDSNITKIKATGETIKSSSFDVVEAFIDFENGTKAHLKANRIADAPLRFSKFFQKESMVMVDYMNRRTEVTRLNGYAKQNGHAVNGHSLPAVFLPEIKDVNAIKEELNTFYDSIVNNTTPPVTISDSLRVLEICEEIKNRIEI
jgi:predicted dehydrogenase